MDDGADNRTRLAARVQSVRAAQMRGIADEEFSGEELDGADLTELDFESTVFRNCRFSTCDFSHASFKNVTWESCDFSNCRILDSYWAHCTVKLSKGDGAEFRSSAFKGTTFLQSSFSYAGFESCVWEHDTIRTCIMRDCILSGSKIKKSTWEDVDLTRAEFFRTPLAGIDLSLCTIEGIVLSDDLGEIRGAKVSALQALDLVERFGVHVVES